MDEFSSIQITKESVLLAYFVKVCASLFPRHFICPIWRDLNSCILWWVSEMMLAIEIGGEAERERAWDIIHESPTKITSQTTISHAKNTNSSITFDSASNGPRGNGRCLLIVAITESSWSQITTPIPTDFDWEKTVASVFTFYHREVGGTQWLSDASLHWDGLRCASWNSLRMNRAFVMISWARKLEFLFVFFCCWWRLISKKKWEKKKNIEILLISILVHTFLFFSLLVPKIEKKCYGFYHHLTNWNSLYDHRVQ